MIDKQILILVGAVSIMFVAVMLIVLNSTSKSDRNFGAIIQAEQDIIRLLMNVNQSQSEDREKSANLTKAEMDQLVRDLQKIPGMTETLDNLTKATAVDSMGAQIHRNLTIENAEDIQEMKDDMNRITGSILSLDNKVNELFFLENATIRPTR